MLPLGINETITKVVNMIENKDVHVRNQHTHEVGILQNVIGEICYILPAAVLLILNYIASELAVPDTLTKSSCENLQR